MKAVQPVWAFSETPLSRRHQGRDEGLDAGKSPSRDLVGPDFEADQCVRLEGLGDRDIGGIAPLRDQDAPILGTLLRGSKVRQCRRSRNSASCRAGHFVARSGGQGALRP